MSSGKKMGRPKAITPEIEEKILTAVINGEFVGMACAKAGVGYSTLARKEIEDGPFGRLLARARVAGADLHVEEADRMIRESKTHEDIGRARELAIHRRWRASKLVPAYSDRIGVEVTADTAPVEKPVEQWTFEDLLDFARRQVFAMAAAKQKLQKLGVLRGADALDKAGVELWSAIDAHLNGPAEPLAALPSPPQEREINPRFAEPEDDDSADVF
jgi:hypothetical protein